MQAAVDACLSSLRCANPNTCCGYAGALDRLWGQRAPATWNRNRAAVAGRLSWCARNRLAVPTLPTGCERRREPADTTRAVSRSAIERALSRRDVPLREKTLRLLYESARPARSSPSTSKTSTWTPAALRSAPKGGDTEWIFWGSGTARLQPRLLRGREAARYSCPNGGPDPPAAAPAPRTCARPPAAPGPAMTALALFD